MQTSYHPSDTSNLVRFNQIDNFALRYWHFLRIDKPKNNDSKYKVNFQRSANKLGKSSQKLAEQLRERQTQQLVQFAKQGIKLYCVDATVDWRLVVGLGGEHVQETNMTLHHIYGIPYIPGSAIKGVLRHWWLQVLQEDQNFLQQNPSFIKGNGEIDESIALKDPVFLSIFGSQEQRGKVQFLDAYPTGVVHFATDIMNPHYPHYYSGSEPPTDHQNPRPISFLTVEKTTFRFAFLAQDQTRLDKLKNRFQKALELKGIGAKTAVGYGYFRDFKDQTATIIGKANPQKQIGQQSTTSNG